MSGEQVSGRWLVDAEMMDVIGEAHKDLITLLRWDYLEGGQNRFGTSDNLCILKSHLQSRALLIRKFT